MKIFGVWFILLFVGAVAFGADIQIKYEYESPNSRVAHPTFSCGGKQLSLPERTSVISTVSNAEKTIWAVNFHETSNYNDVDLALCHGDSPELLTAISDQLVPLLTKKGLIPNCPWDNQELKIIKIENNEIYGRFFGATHSPLRTFIQNFTVRIQMTSKRTQFIMLKAIAGK
jgi:hypothetical protein